VKVIRLHPTRTYDIDQVTFGESTRRAFGLAASASGSAKGLGASGNADIQGNEEESARQKFLSRITKVASFADAADHSFGFNFYPSNLQVEETNIPFGALLLGKATSYKVTGYLEAGARDCAAFIVLPRDLKSFTCEASGVWGDINEGTENVSEAAGKGHQFTVTLPEWDPLELVAATLGAGPTTRAAVATTRPAAAPLSPPG